MEIHVIILAFGERGRRSLSSACDYCESRAEMELNGRVLCENKRILPDMGE